MELAAPCCECAQGSCGAAGSALQTIEIAIGTHFNSDRRSSIGEKQGRRGIPAVIDERNGAAAQIGEEIFADIGRRKSGIRWMVESSSADRATRQESGGVRVAVVGTDIGGIGRGPLSIGPSIVSSGNT